MRFASRSSRCLVLAALVAASAARGATPPSISPPPLPEDPSLAAGERLSALIDRVRWENQQIETLEAIFEQHKESELLLEPEEARGVFSYAAPDRVRWEYQAPNPITLLISGNQLTAWYRDLGKAERMDVGRHSQRVLKYLGASSSLETLIEYFTVSLHLPAARSEPYRLDLEPRFARVAKRLAGMTLWLDRQLFLPVRLQYVEADGDLTEYRFERFRVNGKLPADRFRLALPEGVELNVVSLDRAGQ